MSQVAEPKMHWTEAIKAENEQLKAKISDVEAQLIAGTKESVIKIGDFRDLTFQEWYDSRSSEMDAVRTKIRSIGKCEKTDQAFARIKQGMSELAQQCPLDLIDEVIG